MTPVGTAGIETKVTAELPVDQLLFPMEFLALTQYQYVVPELSPVWLEVVPVIPLRSAAASCDGVDPLKL